MILIGTMESSWPKKAIQLLNILPEVTLDNISVEESTVAGERTQASGIYEQKSAYEDSGLGWLMLSCVDTLHTDNGRLRAVNKQSIATCRNQGPQW